MSGALHRVAKFGFVLEELGQLAEEQFQELLGRHGRAIGMPERGGHHVLDVARLSVGQLYLDASSSLAVAAARPLAAFGAWFWRAFARRFAANRAWLRLGRFANAGPFAALGARLFLLRFAVPFGVAEVVMGVDEIVDREVVLAVVEAGAAADDLLELDHRVDRPHEDDVADVAGVDAGREFLRSGQDRGDCLFVVLEVAEVLLADAAVVGGYAVAVVRGLCWS